MAVITAAGASYVQSVNTTVITTHINDDNYHAIETRAGDIVAWEYVSQHTTTMLRPGVTGKQIYYLDAGFGAVAVYGEDIADPQRSITAVEFQALNQEIYSRRKCLVLGHEGHVTVSNGRAVARPLWPLLELYNRNDEILCLVCCEEDYVSKIPNHMQFCIGNWAKRNT
jgi:hypothetical protein